MLLCGSGSDLSLAAWPELSENSRLGFAGKVTAQDPGLLFVNSQSTLGMHVTLPETRGGSRIQTWNRYAYVANNLLSNADAFGLECVWDNGSYDSENDSQTGSVGNYNSAGGTWVEMGQNGKAMSFRPGGSSNPQSNPQKLMSCTICVYLGGLHAVVSR